MTFKLTCNWLERHSLACDDEVEATLSAVRIIVGRENATEHVQLEEGVRPRASEQAFEKLHIPAYFLAEWVAESWWSLLYEPRKTEDGYRPEFLERHSLLTAQHGYALPDLMFEPAGSTIEVSCRPREVSLAGVRFPNYSNEVIPVGAVRSVLSAFVGACADRLRACGIENTPMQKAWEAVVETTEAEEVFCTLAGALGVNPYSVASDTAAAIDAVHDHLGQAAALDLCMASSESDLADSRRLLDRVTERLQGAHMVTLAPLAKIRLPQDSTARRGWFRGKQVALRAREQLGIKASDETGADKIFAELKVNTDAALYQNIERLVFSGAVDRRDDDANIVLVQAQEEARRFAAFRAVYLAVDSGPHSRRIVTDTATRDQQASRAFAAEMLVPSDYLKARASNGRLPRGLMFEIAKERRASFEVVQRQAENNGLVSST